MRRKGGTQFGLGDNKTSASPIGKPEPKDLNKVFSGRVKSSGGGIAVEPTLKIVRSRFVQGPKGDAQSFKINLLLYWEQVKRDKCLFG